jgi:hypothetical protein
MAGSAVMVRSPHSRRHARIVAIDAAGDEIFAGTDLTAPYFTAVRDCARVVRLIDQAYARAAASG